MTSPAHNRSDFAQTLRDKSEKRIDETAQTPKPESSDQPPAETPGDEVATTAVENAAPDPANAESAGFSEQSSTEVSAKPAAADAGEPAESPAPAASTHDENDDKPAHTAEPPTPDAARDTPDATTTAVQIKSQPVTAHDLAFLLLRGQSSEKFALVAPGERDTPNAAPSKTAPRSAPSRDAATANAVATSDAAPADKPRVAPQSAESSATAPPAPASSRAQTPDAAPADKPAPAAARTENFAAAKPVVQPTVVPNASAALLDRLAANSPHRAASSTSTLTPDRREFAAQVERGLAAAVNQRTGEVTLRLTPATLGPLRIQVSVDDGAVAATLHTASAQTRELLESSAESLRTALADKGIEVRQIRIAFADPAPRAADPNHASTDQSRHQHDSTSAGGDNAHSGAHTPDRRDAHHQPRQPSDPADLLAVDLAHLTPESAAKTAQYVTLPDGRLGLVALA